jgi:hypothetical protein
MKHRRSVFAVGAKPACDFFEKNVSPVRFLRYTDKSVSGCRDTNF